MEHFQCPSIQLSSPKYATNSGEMSSGMVTWTEILALPPAATVPLAGEICHLSWTMSSELGSKENSPLALPVFTTSKCSSLASPSRTGSSNRRESGSAAAAWAVSPSSAAATHDRRDPVKSSSPDRALPCGYWRWIPAARHLPSTLTDPSSSSWHLTTTLAFMCDPWVKWGLNLTLTSSSPSLSTIPLLGWQENTLGPKLEEKFSSSTHSLYRTGHLETYLRLKVFSLISLGTTKPKSMGLWPSTSDMEGSTPSPTRLTLMDSNLVDSVSFSKYSRVSRGAKQRWMTQSLASAMGRTAFRT
mmetsp:Transcript_6943/g.23888  ORF Transcript_6943/g.23888 Transcript_6943/m.23888 type:complete len:301 (+) Transcript_6943:138-1040(+)